MDHYACGRKVGPGLTKLTGIISERLACRAVVFFTSVFAHMDACDCSDSTSSRSRLEEHDAYVCLLSLASQCYTNQIDGRRFYYMLTANVGRRCCWSVGPSHAQGNARTTRLAGFKRPAYYFASPHLMQFPLPRFSPFWPCVAFGQADWPEENLPASPLTDIQKFGC